MPLSLLFKEGSKCHLTLHQWLFFFLGRFFLIFFVQLSFLCRFFRHSHLVPELSIHFFGETSLRNFSFLCHIHLLLILFLPLLNFPENLPGILGHLPRSGRTGRCHEGPSLRPHLSIRTPSQERARVQGPVRGALKPPVSRYRRHRRQVLAIHTQPLCQPRLDLKLVLLLLIFLHIGPRRLEKADELVSFVVWCLCVLVLEMDAPVPLPPVTQLVHDLPEHLQSRPARHGASTPHSASWSRPRAS